MPELTVLHIALLAVSAAVGAAVAWTLRGNRCAEEKATVGEGWQQRVDAEHAEQGRLLEQNKSLMEQISQLQASSKDGTNRARELSDALKEAFARRDELQRELKDIRGNLETAVAERDRLQSDVQDSAAHGKNVETAMKEKDDKIFRLSRELENWQNRLPPLIDRFRRRDEEAIELEASLAEARARVAELEARDFGAETRIEPADSSALPDGLDPANDPAGITQTGIPDVLAGENDDTPAEDADYNSETDEVGSDYLLAESDDIPAEDDKFTADEPEDEAEVHGAGEADIADSDELSDSAEAAPDDDISMADDSHVDVNVNGGEDQQERSETAGNGASQYDADTFAAVTSEEGEQADDEDTGVADHIEIDLPQNDRPGVSGNRSMRDNLKMIKGVGPAIEKTLNELGIFRFNQIAEMSEYDIDRVARRLKGFRSRIYREDWIGQARDLHAGKRTEH